MVVEAEGQHRWHRLIVAHIAKLEVERASMWMELEMFKNPETDMCGTGASDRLKVASEKLSGPSGVVADDRNRLSLSIRTSAEVYLELYGLSKSMTMHRVLASANRWSRDLVVWRSFGLGGMINSERFLEVLDIAFDGALADDNELKSQMMQAWCKIRAALGLPEEKRAKKNSNKESAQKSCNTAPVDDTAAYDNDAWPYHWHVIPPVWFYNFIPPVFTRYDTCEGETVDFTNGGDEDVVSAAVFAPHGSPSQQVCRSNLSDGASQEGTAEHLSLPATEESLIFPRWQRPSPMKQPSKRGSQPPGLESIVDEEDDAGSEGSSEKLPSQVCQDCGFEDWRGWANRSGQYWCRSCWEKWTASWEKWNQEDTGVAQAEPAKPMNKQQYEMMDEVPLDDRQRFQTEVRVESMCGLTAACIVSACIVMFHPGPSIISHSAKSLWPFSALWKRTSLGDSFEAELMPRHGGIYWPEIAVCKDEFGEAASPVSVPLVLGSPPQQPENSVESVEVFRREMRIKISNLLRICQWHAHEELVISGAFRQLPTREIAGLFHELLQTSGDLVGVFRRVIVALPQEEVPAKTLMSFREEFKYTKLVDEQRTSWKEGNYLVPGNLPDHCLHVPIRDTKLPEINGVKLHACKILASCEQQLWVHVPCGRIVLAALPQLCLSAKDARHGVAVHLWQKLHDDAKNMHLQTWHIAEDGKTTLASHPSLHLCLTRDGHAHLCTEEADITLWSWMPKQVLELPA
mmetsp:Transcript_112843/g.224520  ORF Transcript_112843/g.224520 Transcript_112843/m.224520 type:complete len:743 (-) Transcript_112843:162-2390(-)|eukprot:CAMPEP_0172715052 /NCGR_PEP_ID=MMETSP1074-20121228/67321_1 /TAXON_ID=2916 /ORGANISM="Ceratium fusus, Strain PA161109" /LENGTH=742 /DNA_ID=CAMNT_0013539589 /DNA_START=31 /DNA_END=2259 /DNA_ORIENTATION=-